VSVCVRGLCIAYAWAVKSWTVCILCLLYFCVIRCKDYGQLEELRKPCFGRQFGQERRLCHVKRTVATLLTDKERSQGLLLSDVRELLLVSDTH